MKAVDARMPWVVIGGRPPAFDADRYKQRNVVERCFAKLKQWRAVATRYDKTAVNYLGGCTLAAAVLWLRGPFRDTP